MARTTDSMISFLRTQSLERKRKLCQDGSVAEEDGRTAKRYIRMSEIADMVMTMPRPQATSSSSCPLVIPIVAKRPTPVSLPVASSSFSSSSCSSSSSSPSRNRNSENFELTPSHMAVVNRLVARMKPELVKTVLSNSLQWSSRSQQDLNSLAPYKQLPAPSTPAIVAPSVCSPVVDFPSPRSCRLPVLLPAIPPALPVSGKFDPFLHHRPQQQLVRHLVCP
eukprot:GILJ01010811.1.p1 GENE.GILJ01010811.1~~GILJ01010811.1.p1  ORF type:complete len:241 (-),score=21.08 GILJ01010811.1:412-1077(-)